MKRAKMSAQERSWRSQLSRFIAHQPFIHATLSPRERVCGTPNCRCTRGEKHRSLYLTRVRKGDLEQLFIPRDQEDQVRQWVANYHRLCELLDHISEEAWERLRHREF